MNDFDLISLVIRQHYPGLSGDVNDPAHQKIDFPELLEFVRNPDNFVDSNLTDESRGRFFALLDQKYQELSSGSAQDSTRPERYLCKTILNYYQAKQPRKFKDLGYELERVDDTGVSTGANDGDVRQYQKQTNQGERKYYVKGTQWPVKELYLSWLFRALVPGTPPVKVQDKGKGVVASKMMGGKGIDSKVDPEGRVYFDSVDVQNTGLQENILMSALIKDSDFNDRNILQSPTGKFIRIDFERAGFGVYNKQDKIENLDLNKMNFIDTTRVPYMIENFRELEATFSQSEVFRKDVYKAIIKIALYPEQVIRQQFADAKAMLGKGRVQFDLEGFFTDREALIQIALADKNFAQYIEKSTHFDEVYAELAIAENGKGRVRIAPYQNQMIKAFQRLGGKYKKSMGVSAWFGSAKRDNAKKSKFSLLSLFTRKDQGGDDKEQHNNTRKSFFTSKK